MTNVIASALRLVALVALALVAIVAVSHMTPPILAHAAELEESHDEFTFVHAERIERVELLPANDPTVAAQVATRKNNVVLYATRVFAYGNQQRAELMAITVPVRIRREDEFLGACDPAGRREYVTEELADMDATLSDPRQVDWDLYAELLGAEVETWYGC